MIWKTLESKLSAPRMSRYLQGYKGVESKAAEAYLHNMRIAESLVSVFHVLEVSLRNGIQKEMAIHYGRDDWYGAWAACGDLALERLYHKVREAEVNLTQRCLAKTPDNIVSELNFGFWTAMFNRASINKLSRPLMKVFYYCPKAAKQPDLIRARLNHGRNLRNRCFHHEPLLWQPLFQLHRDISEVVQWIDPALSNWLKAHDRFPDAMANWRHWTKA